MATSNVATKSNGTAPAAKSPRTSTAGEIDTRLGPLRKFATPFADLKMQVRNWQRLAFLATSVAGICAVGFVLKSQQPTQIPYVVAIDKSSGQYVNMGIPPRQDSAPDYIAPITQYTVSQFVAGVRTVTPDQDMQNYLVTHYVTPFVTPGSQAAAMLNDYFKANNPFDLGAKEIVTVNVDIPTPITATTYQISWTEQVEDTAGHVQRTLSYTGTATTAFSKVPTEQQKFNPLGIFVKELHWNLKSTVNNAGVR